MTFLLKTELASELLFEPKKKDPRTLHYFRSTHLYVTHHLGEPLGASGSGQQTQHHLRSAQDGLLTLGGHTVLAGKRKLNSSKNTTTKHRINQ